MAKSLRVVDSRGPMDRVLKDENGRLRSFPEIMYQLYSSDARMFVAGCLKETLDNPPQFIRNSPLPLRRKANQLLSLEITVKFCESAEDLAAFAVAFAVELYMDALAPEDVWMNLAQYGSGEVYNFYRDIGKRSPGYFANLHGFPPLHLQKTENQAILLRSCRQLAAYLGKISDSYMKLRELHNAYKHGMRIFATTLTDNRTGRQIPALSYVNENAAVKTILFPISVVEELYDMCIRIGQTIGTILPWHDFRLKVDKQSERILAFHVFGHSHDTKLEAKKLMFPGLFETRNYHVARAEEIAKRKSQELSKFPLGHIIAIDIDSEEILDCHGLDLRDVIWKASESKPGATLVFRRISANGKVGPY